MATECTVETTVTAMRSLKEQAVDFLMLVAQMGEPVQVDKEVMRTVERMIDDCNGAIAAIVGDDENLARRINERPCGRRAITLVYGLIYRTRLNNHQQAPIEEPIDFEREAREVLVRRQAEEARQLVDAFSDHETVGDIRSMAATLQELHRANLQAGLIRLCGGTAELRDQFWSDAQGRLDKVRARAAEIAAALPQVHHGPMCKGKTKKTRAKLAAAGLDPEAKKRARSERDRMRETGSTVRRKRSGKK